MTTEVANSSSARESEHANNGTHFRYYALRSAAPFSRGEPPGIELVLWTPSLVTIAPAGLHSPAAVVWWLFHVAHLFSNRDYAIVIGYFGSEIVHRSFVFPRYVRFPFMSKSDLQIGDTWTHADFRGRGIAGAAIALCAERLAQTDRVFWYVTEAENLPSVRAIESAGGVCIGTGRRTSRFGLRILGQFTIAGEQSALTQPGQRGPKT